MKCRLSQEPLDAVQRAEMRRAKRARLSYSGTLLLILRLVLQVLHFRSNCILALAEIQCHLLTANATRVGPLLHPHRTHPLPPLFFFFPFSSFTQRQRGPGPVEFAMRRGQIPAQIKTLFFLLSPTQTIRSRAVKSASQ